MRHFEAVWAYAWGQSPEWWAAYVHQNPRVALHVRRCGISRAVGNKFRDYLRRAWHAGVDG